jgi:hypothetical protein
VASIVRFINQPPAPELDGGLHWHDAWEGKKIDRTSTTTTAPKPMILGVPRRPFSDVFGYGMDMKHHCSGSSSTTCMAFATSKIGRAACVGSITSCTQANWFMGLIVRMMRRNTRVDGQSAGVLTSCMRMVACVQADVAAYILLTQRHNITAEQAHEAVAAAAPANGRRQAAYMNRNRCVHARRRTHHEEGAAMAVEVVASIPPQRRARQRRRTGTGSQA